MFLLIESLPLSLTLTYGVTHFLYIEIMPLVYFLIMIDYQIYFYIHFSYMTSSISQGLMHSGKFNISSRYSGPSNHLLSFFLQFDSIKLKIQFPLVCKGPRPCKADGESDEQKHIINLPCPSPQICRR